MSKDKNEELKLSEMLILASHVVVFPVSLSRNAGPPGV